MVWKARIYLYVQHTVLIWVLALSNILVAWLVPEGACILSVKWGIAKWKYLAQSGQIGHICPVFHNSNN